MPGRCPGLNELIDAGQSVGSKRGFAGRRYNGYHKLKQQCEERVVLCARAQQLRPMTRAHFRYLIVEEDKRRDPSNLLAGAMKVVEDGLQRAGVFANDGWKQVLSIGANFVVADKSDAPGVFVAMYVITGPGSHFGGMEMETLYLRAKRMEFINV